MKDVLKLESKEQLELIGDPFVHDILDALGYEVLSRSEIIEKMAENPDLISDYLKVMTKNDILTKVEEEKYRVTAKSIEGSEAVYKYLKDSDLHWLHGYINHLENRIVDFFEYLSKFDDMQEKLKELDYTTEIFASSSKVYLTSEEADELINMIGEYLKQDREEVEEKKKDPKYNLYEFYGYMFPELKEMKKKEKK